MANESVASPSQVAVVPLPAASPSGPVVFTATEDRIWVKFYDGQGQQILQKELAKGESFTVPSGAQEPKLWTGRPDALAISVGGQAVPRIAEREGIVKDVPVSAAALLARGTAAAPPPPPATASTAALSSPTARSNVPRAVIRETGNVPVPMPASEIQAVPMVETPPASTQMN